MTNRFFTLTALLATLAASGCASLEGDWETKDVLNGGSKKSTMFLDGDGAGEATVYIQGDRLEYDIFWEDVGDGKLEVEMDCVAGNCRQGDDFTMDCREKADGDELSCDGDEGWTNVELRWERFE